ncbi:hypothetical protein D3C78_1005880 [compost metagenome]
MELLADNDQLILIAQFFRNLSDGVSWISRNDAIHQTTAEGVGFIQPVYKALSKIPQVSIFQNNLLKLIPISVNQLARNDDKTFRSITVKKFKTLIQ